MKIVCSRTYQYNELCKTIKMKAIVFVSALLNYPAEIVGTLQSTTDMQLPQYSVTAVYFKINIKVSFCCFKFNLYSIIKYPIIHKINLTQSLEFILLFRIGSAG